MQTEADMKKIVIAILVAQLFVGSCWAGIFLAHIQQGRGEKVLQPLSSSKTIILGIKG
jgi:hypothetical protein